MDTNKAVNNEQNKQGTDQSILQSSKDSAGEIADFLAELENNYFVIKGLFFGKYSLVTGLIEFIANISTGELYRVRLVASLNKDYRRDMPLELGWDSFANLVTDSLLNRKYLTNSFTQSLNDHFKRTCTQEFNLQIYELISTDQFEEVQKNLRREIHKAVKEDVKVEIQYEIVDFSYLTAGEATERVKNDNADKAVSVDDFSIYLHTELIVDPLNGKRILDLKKGEIVYAHIKEKTKSGIYFSQLLGALKDGELLPVKAKINRIDKVPNDTYDRFFTEVVFGPGIAGRTIISSEIRIAVFQPAVAGKDEPPNQQNASDDVKIPDMEGGSLQNPASRNRTTAHEKDLLAKRTNLTIAVFLTFLLFSAILFVLWKFFR